NILRASVRLDIACHSAGAVSGIGGRSSTVNGALARPCAAGSSGFVAGHGGTARRVPARLDMDAQDVAVQADLSAMVELAVAGVAAHVEVLLVETADELEAHGVGS